MFQTVDRYKHYSDNAHNNVGHVYWTISWCYCWLLDVQLSLNVDLRKSVFITITEYCIHKLIMMEDPVKTCGIEKDIVFKN